MHMSDWSYFVLDKGDFSDLERGQEVFLSIWDPEARQQTHTTALAVGCEGGDFIAVCISSLGKAEQLRLPLSKLQVRWSAKVKDGITLKTPSGTLIARAGMEIGVGESGGIRILCVTKPFGRTIALSDVFAHDGQTDTPAGIRAVAYPNDWGAEEAIVFTRRTLEKKDRA